jgi:ariadne-1
MIRALDFPDAFSDPFLLQYYNRWANHEQSAKLSMDLYAKTEKKMEEMQLTSALTWIEVQFMKKAVDEVFRCRMTLKWTYAMAYYLQKGNEKELFEDNQRFRNQLTWPTVHRD